MNNALRPGPRPLVKICGNRFPADAWLVAAARPDLMGWIFSPRSPRRIPVELATRLIRQIRLAHPGIRHVAVLADNSVPWIQQLLRQGPGFDFLQVADGPGLVTALDARLPGCRNYISGPLPEILPVIRVRSHLTDIDLSGPYGRRSAWFMDAYVPGQPGGTGRRFATELVSELRRPFLVAGGLNPDNVAGALRETGAIGADVSSGIEIPGSPGRKSPEKLRRFVAAVRNL